MYDGDFKMMMRFHEFLLSKKSPKFSLVVKSRRRDARAEVTKQHRHQPDYDDDDFGRLGLLQERGCLMLRGANVQRSYKLSQADGRRHEFRQAGNTTQYFELSAKHYVYNTYYSYI